MDVGLIQQTDIDHRNLGFENTVALSEDMLSLSAAFAVLGSPRPAGAAEKGRHRPAVTYNKATSTQRQELTVPTIEEKIKSATLPGEKPYTGMTPTKPDDGSFALPWYENPSIVMLLLVLLFPLGLYACYRNSSLSAGVKTFAIVACLFLLISLIVISLMPDWLFSAIPVKYDAHQQIGPRSALNDREHGEKSAHRRAARGKSPHFPL